MKKIAHLGIGSGGGEGASVLARKFPSQNKEKMFLLKRKNDHLHHFGTLRDG